MVSCLEFKQLLDRLDVRTLAGVTYMGKIASLWRARFPDTELHAPEWPPKPGDLPALWVSLQPNGSSTSVLVVLGSQTDGALSSLDERGTRILLTPAKACQGRILALKPGESPARPQPSVVRDYIHDELQTLAGVQTPFRRVLISLSVTFKRMLGRN